jgi:hypothetical protein
MPHTSPQVAPLLGWVAFFEHSALSTIQVTDNWREVINDPSIEAVVIGTWPYMHALLTMEALKAGKHVLCEARMVSSTPHPWRSRDPPFYGLLCSESPMFRMSLQLRPLCPLWRPFHIAELWREMLTLPRPYLLWPLARATSLFALQLAALAPQLSVPLLSRARQGFNSRSAPTGSLL